MRLNHLLTILSIIILFAILPVKSNFTYEENQTENLGSPRVYNIDSYDDNTIVVQIIRVKGSTIAGNNEICLDNGYLSFRTIHSNGSIVPIDISMDELGIQPLKFCDQSLSSIEIYAVKNNFLLVTYMKAMALNDVFTFEDWGMVVDLNGNILRLEKN